MPKDLETRLAALQPAAQDRLAAEILAQLKPRISWMPYLSSGIVGALVGAAAMFLVMCTLAKPQVVVVQEVPVELRPSSPREASPAANDYTNRDYRPEIAVFGVRLTPQRNNSLDLDAMLAERTEIAKRSRPMVASVYPKFEIGRRETNINVSPQEYQKFLETML
ncbi:MAG: hypothetical protein FWC43_02095 [Planctomycetaceae bacterium]|nr:hypothetical protein [Planctomycetaceae bacterium]